MIWTPGDIEGCSTRPLAFYHDDRGWLAEVFRVDELNGSLHPAMTYISQTDPGVTRGPHEHRDQTDLFAFFSGTVRLFLWDNRRTSDTYGNRLVLLVGEQNPSIVAVPPGVVHAYRNEGEHPVLIINCPNRLYAGPNKSEPVDEIRHEENVSSVYKME